MPASLEIIVSLVALVGAAYGMWEWDRPRRNGARLENYLRGRRRGYKSGRYPNYQHTEVHLKRELGLNQEELLEASNHTNNVNRVVTQKANGMAKEVLYEYNGTDC